MQKLQCEICGGSLMMTEDGESAVCESCGMRFKKETIKKMILELSGPVKIDGPVQVEGIQGSSSLADRAETFLRLGETGKANAAFQQLTDEYPADYRGWWGLTRLFDWKSYFYNLGAGEAQPPLVYQRALDFSEGAAKAEIQRYYDEKIKTVKSKTDARLNGEQAARDKAEREYQQNMELFDAAYNKVMAEYQTAEQAVADAQNCRNQLKVPEPKYTFCFSFGKLFAVIVLSLLLRLGVSVSSGPEMLFNLIFMIPLLVIVIGFFKKLARRGSSRAQWRQYEQDMAEATSVCKAAAQAKAVAESKLNATQKGRPQKQTTI